MVIRVADGELHPDVAHFLKTGLREGEELVAVADGLEGDTLALTSERAIVIKRGMGAWATGGVGLKTKSWPYESIASVDLQKRWITCDLEIVGAGMVEKRAGGFFESGRAEHIFQFPARLMARMEGVVAEIWKRVNAAKRSAAPGPDPIDQLRKLAELRDAGVVTAEEFETQKQKLLSRT